MDGLLTPTESLKMFMEYINSIPYKKKLIEDLNYLICCFEQDPRNMMNTAVDLKIALERFGLLDVCRIYVDLDNFKLRLCFIGCEDDECE